MNKVRFIISILLLPALIVLIFDFLKFLLTFASRTDIYIVPFWIGILVYVLFQIIFFKPMRTYVFGHELTHAIAGLISGAKIKKFSVSQNKGSVSLTKDNIFITLAPYFIPLYTIALIILYYFVIAWFVDIYEYQSYFFFFAGISIAFHYALTFYAIKIGQEDLKVYGNFFSLVIILIINILILILILALIFPHYIVMKYFFSSIIQDVYSIYKYIFIGAYQCLVSLKTK